MDFDGLCVLRMAVADMAALKVRIRSSQRPAPPDCFYQALPPEAATLLGTLPCGRFAVSIPQGATPWGGWRFEGAPPAAAAGPVIVYRLQGDCRYEAVAVRDGGRERPLDEYARAAARRLRERCGDLVRVPGAYAYAAPDKEEWAGVLADGGHVALNPARLPLTPPPAPAHPAERFGHCIQVRAPLYAGERPSTPHPLAAFSRVEVFSESVGDRWLAFDEYQGLRRGRAAVPTEFAAAFGAWLARLTAEAGFGRWRFRPGMGFGEETEWWGPRGRRRTAHEGLDFVEGFRRGGVSPVSEGVPARAVADGEVVATLDDFMGETVVVRHPSSKRRDGTVFHTLLSHIQTARGADARPSRPAPVRAGEPLGRVGRRAGVRIRPHLHLTGAWYPDGFPFADAGVGTVLHPGFTPALLADLNPLVESSPLCLTTPDDKGFLAED
ncbi:MAG: M23 family metallopeptidase [Acidobacteriota bacterium]|jgi:murein DD-endopeptidase MepM/ murein hydrolase activator NlpD|nr:M23 family metallopeptidase [Acidobacteriota bacterium]